MTPGLALARGARLALASLPDLRTMLRLRSAVQDPALPMRDPWPGDPARGAQLMRGELSVRAAGRILLPDEWTMDLSDALREAAHSFSWLRDLRALGADGARARARLLVSNWLETVSPDRLINRPDIIGARLTAWLGHYDFFAASAGESFRARLMGRIHADARILAACMPPPMRDGRALCALKGLFAASVALPDYPGWMKRALRLLPAMLAEQVRPDGGHCERSPSAHLRALQDLLEIRGLMQMAGLPPHPALASAIERLALGLGALRHGDGGLALFNGSQEEDSALIDGVLGSARRPVRGVSSLPAGGFHRLQAGRSLLIVDSGLPPPPGLDRLAHAGVLSFELSVGRERMIVNCGAAPNATPVWSQAMRATAAHSTLVLNDINSSHWDGPGRRPSRVDAQVEEAHGAYWLELAHDGYRNPYGAVHRRRFYMSESGEDIRGEDTLDSPAPHPFAVRFHLHPAASCVLQDDTLLIRLPSGGLWRLRADGGTPSLEESLYLGEDERQESRQLVLSVPAGAPPSVRWAITKIG